MALILGIETSCDETGAAVYDSKKKILLSNAVFSQIDLHKKYGGVVPEIASRSHLKKIGIIVQDHKVFRLFADQELKQRI